MHSEKAAGKYPIPCSSVFPHLVSQPYCNSLDSDPGMVGGPHRAILTSSLLHASSANSATSCPETSEFRLREGV